MAKHFENLLKFTSASFYGKDVPRKYWLSGTIFYIGLIALCLFGGYSFSFAIRSLVSFENMFINGLIIIISISLFINISLLALNVLSKKLSFSAIPAIIMLYILIIFHSFSWVKISISNRLIQELNYKHRLNNENNYKRFIHLSEVKNQDIIGDPNFYILVFLQAFMFSVFIYNRRAVCLVLEKEEKLQQSEQELNKINIEREEDQVKSIEAITALEQKSIQEQLRIFSAVQHELGNKIPSLKNDLSDLLDFLTNIKQKDINILDEPIRPALPGEKILEIATLKDLMQRMNKKISYAISTIDSLGTIIKASPNSYLPENINLYDYLTNEAGKRTNDLKNVIIIIEGDKNIHIDIDTKQFSFLIQNFISNAIRHGGFEISVKENFILFKFFKKEDDIILEIINNGVQLDPGYKIEQFLEPYNYFGSTGNSGLGGYLIGVVINNHKGKIQIIDKLYENPEFKVCFRLVLPIKSIK
jgi:signal transduction histidine kinase